MEFKGKQIISRMRIVMLLFAVLLAILIGKSFYLQILPNQKLSHLKQRLFERTVTLKPRRGSIYDRYGKELAISIAGKSLFADPKHIKQPYYAAKKLSQLFRISHKKLLNKFLNKNTRFVWIKRHLNKKQIYIIKSWKLKGLYFLKEKQRFYTNQNSLSQVLGFTGVDGQGLEGIEKQYNNVLKGESQNVLIQRDAKGRPLFIDSSPFISRVSGFDVYLTIDSALQFYLEKELQAAIKKAQAKSGIAVILSAKNSEILAMANLPNFNPNKPTKNKYFSHRNRAVTDMFEPGSTLKIFTMISALQQGIPLSKHYSSHNGKLKIGRHIISEADSKKKFKSLLNMSDILTWSSNVGTAQIALDLGAKHLRNTLINFGFNQKTHVDFPGEASGILKNTPWKPIETATISFGHGIASTALQVANAYAAIANQGVLNQPFLVKHIRNPYTGEARQTIGKKIKRVLTLEEARTITFMLVNATEKSGTGFKARVPGYFVAGKTGTAQKVDLKNTGYKKGEYITSFAGFIPAHKPQFVIYVMIDGAISNFYASHLAAPLFSQVASYAVRKAGLSPSLFNKKNILLAQKSKQNKTELTKIVRKLASTNQKIPNLKNLSLREILRQTQDFKFKFKIKGAGKLAYSIPHVGQDIPKNKTITLVFK